MMLEDYNDKLERIDRFLAHLTLARLWNNYAGILLGDFHQGEVQQTPAVLELLKYHLPTGWRLPILVTRQIGHVWPMAPLPLHLPMMIEGCVDGFYMIRWPAEALRTV